MGVDEGGTQRFMAVDDPVQRLGEGADVEPPAQTHGSA